MQQAPDSKSGGGLPVLVVDDQAAFRGLVRVLLAARAGISVVGEASSGEEALALLPTLKPEVVILDVQLPGMNGFETAWRMLDASPGLRVVMVSAYDFQYQALARTVGAVGFLNKRQFSAESVARILGLTSNE